MRSLSIAIAALAIAGTIIVGCGRHLPTEQQASSPDVSLRGTNAMIAGPGAAIGDFIWADQNANGIQDLGEPPVVDATITLTPLGGGEVALGEGYSTKSDEKGHYEFTGLLPGDYAISATHPNGCKPTKELATKPDLDSNPNPGTVKLGDDPDITVDFGFVCDEPCGPCRGRLTSLTLRYDGEKAAQVTVLQRGHRQHVIFRDMLDPGDTFTLEGKGKKDGFGQGLALKVNGKPDARIPATCSGGIRTGWSRGSFTIVAGESRRGGPLCPYEPKSSGKDTIEP